MKIYDFNKPIDRRGSHCVKYDALGLFFGREDLLPLWVADMDFETPDFIIEALHRRLDHAVLGYPVQYDAYWQSVIDWIAGHHGWQVEREWMQYIPGIVKGIAMAINAFTQKGDKIIIQPPVYHPFRNVPTNSGREVVDNPLRRVGDSYEMDFEHLESIIDNKCKMIILANPHNPVGITWDSQTLKRLAEIATKHNLIVISDEIHCDMALFGNKHIPFASVSPEAAQCSITFGAPSKTFNIAGIVSSYAIVPDPALRERFFKWIEASELGAPHLFAPIATMAAFSQGENWRQQMLRYLEGNIEFIEDFCAREMPQIKPLRPQASFLVWLDCRSLNLSHEALNDLFTNKAGLALNDGEMFNPGGEGFMRLNIGTPRHILERAMQQLLRAVRT